MKKTEITLSKLLTERKQTIAVAESCTGGLLANRLTNIAGSSRYFLQAVIAYHNRAKISRLKIPASLIEEQGAVSKPVACLMAENIMKSAGADYGIGITGIAGPGGTSLSKPVGTVFIAVSSRKKTIVKKFIFCGRRLAIKRKATDKSLLLLKNLILNKK